MKDRFFEAAQRLFGRLQAGELLLCSLTGERSDFVRFNRGKVRQAGSVEQAYVTVRLVRGRRQAVASLVFPEALERDADGALGSLRASLEGLPEDPWLLVDETPHAGESVRRGRLAPPEAIVEQAVGAAAGLDFVGIYAGGTIFRGFASALGQRHWHEVDSFHFDWSLYLEADKAAKASYAGFEWEGRAFEARLRQAASQLAFLSEKQRTVAPGEYRAYLAPAAMEELMGMLSWGGFSARARATRQSPLLRMQEGAHLSPALTLVEDTAAGIGPAFQGDGFLRPDTVTLVERGRLGDALVSPRSAKEYGLANNAANAGEAPEALAMQGGELEDEQVLAALGDGLFIANLWYLNYSDRPAGRITGMTRFATFLVENGRIAAPVAPVRFDDSIYRMLGENLAGLTRSRELRLSTSTYGERSTDSMRLPGALVSRLRFTL
jgi:predicted Zn-dependent protease